MDFIGCCLSSLFFILSRQCLEIRKRLHGPSIRVWCVWCVVIAFAWVALSSSSLPVAPLLPVGCEHCAFFPVKSSCWRTQRLFRRIACWPWPLVFHPLALFAFLFSLDLILFFLFFVCVFSLAVASRHRPGHDSQAEWHCSVKGNTARNRSKNGFLISKFFFLFSECAGAQIDSRVRRLHTAGPCIGQEL